MQIELVKSVRQLYQESKSFVLIAKPEMEECPTTLNFQDLISVGQNAKKHLKIN